MKEKLEVEHVEDVNDDTGTTTFYHTQQCGGGAPTTPQHTELILHLSRAIPQRLDELYGEKDLGENGQRARSSAHRELVDWAKNDMRSLLIVPHLLSNWEGKVPQIVEPGYSVMVLSPDLSNEAIAHRLADSDLYVEYRKLAPFETRLALAQCAVQSSWTGIEPTVSHWRHMIETYLLNLACEVQCRIDFKQASEQLRRRKRQVGARPRTNELERRQLWRTCQSSLYARLGLDWSVDDV